MICLPRFDLFFLFGKPQLLECRCWNPKTATASYPTPDSACTSSRFYLLRNNSWSKKIYPAMHKSWKVGIPRKIELVKTSRVLNTVVVYVYV